jgi:hypothetical protein
LRFAAVDLRFAAADLAAGLRAGALRADFFAADFRADFRAAGLRADFRAVDLRAVERRAVLLRAVDFRAAGRLAVFRAVRPVFRAVFRAVRAVLRAALRAGRRFAAVLRAVFLAAFRTVRPAFRAVFRAVRAVLRAAGLRAVLRAVFRLAAAPRRAGLLRAVFFLLVVRFFPVVLVAIGFAPILICDVASTRSTGRVHRNHASLGPGLPPHMASQLFFLSICSLHQKVAIWRALFADLQQPILSKRTSMCRKMCITAHTDSFR